MEDGGAVSATNTVANPSSLTQTRSLDEELAELAKKLEKEVFSVSVSKMEKASMKLLRDMLGLRSTPDQAEKYSRETANGVSAMLQLLGRVDHLPHDFVDRTRVDVVLLRVSESKWGYSEVNRYQAAELKKRFEAENWGRSAMQPDLSLPIQTPATPTTASAALPTSAVMYNTLVPPATDPIFGLQGPMRGLMIKVKKDKATGVILWKKPRLNPAIQRVKSDVHGHNGFEVGHLFLRLRAALAQGAHGHHQAGICGTEHDGAFSVVVSGMYQKHDRDNLQSFEYCAPDALTNKNPDQISDSQGCRVLRRSCHLGQKVRVLRGPNKKIQHAPAFGYRYDGLYTIVAERHVRNDSGGLFASFRFIRADDQPPIDPSRPNASDVNDEEALKRLLR